MGQAGSLERPSEVLQDWGWRGSPGGRVQDMFASGLKGSPGPDLASPFREEAPGCRQVLAGSPVRPRQVLVLSLFPPLHTPPISFIKETSRNSHLKTGRLGEFTGGGRTREEGMLCPASEPPQDRRLTAGGGTQVTRAGDVEERL